MPAEAGALSLRETIQATLETNPLIRAAEANRRATDHELRQSQALLLPNVRLEGDAGREKIDRPQGFAADVNDRWRTRRQIGVTVNQVVFDGWDIANRIYRDAARVDSAALRALSRSETLALSAIEAFVDVYRQRRVLIVARKNVTRHRQILRQVQTRKDGGRSNIGEVQQVRERLTAANSALLQIRQSLANASAKFNRIVGRYPKQLRRPAPPGKLPRTRHEAVDIGVSNNPLVLSANADIDAAKSALDGSRSAYYPRLSLELRGGYGDNLNGTPGPNEELSGRMVLNWNLFNGGARRARSREFAERVAEAQAVRDSRMREMVELIDRAMSAIGIGARRVRTAERQANVALKVVRTYEEEFRLSKRSLLDLLDSESARFNAETQLIGARSVLLFAKYRLLGATGSLLQYFGIKTSNEMIAGTRESVQRRGLFSTTLPSLRE
ncbi:MAG: TolC family outer membrane protein [Pseudomonadota bacterium]